jgi:hypothetical protein
MSNAKTNGQPCPICHEIMFIIGSNKKGAKLTSCGHKYSFKKTRSQKELDRKYVKTEFGLELK